MEQERNTEKESKWHTMKSISFMCFYHILIIRVCFMHFSLILWYCIYLFFNAPFVPVLQVVHLNYTLYASTNQILK